MEKKDIREAILNHISEGTSDLQIEKMVEEIYEKSRRTQLELKGEQMLYDKIEALISEDTFPELPLYERLRGVIGDAKRATDYFKSVKNADGFERTVLSDLIVDYLCNTHIDYSQALIDIIEKIAMKYSAKESVKFADWVAVQFYRYDVGSSTWDKFTGGPVYTTEQLLEMYQRNIG